MSGNAPNEEGGQGRNSESDGDLAARLKRLEANLERKKPSASPGHDSRPVATEGPSPLGQAMRLSSEFIAGVAVGGGLGWTFDHFLGTKPWGLMTLLLLGFLAGIYNVMRVSGFSRRDVTKNGREGS